MRLFVAIQIPEAIRNDLARWLASLSQAIADPKRRLRWVKADQFHLTLKFLGETRDDRLAPLSNSLRLAAKEHRAFPLSFSNVGHFGGRIVWMGLTAGMEEAAQIARSIENACASIGFPHENRPFQPHMTLARSTKSPGRVHLKDLPPSISEQAFGPFPVTEVNLVQSFLTPQGSHYKILENYPLINS